MPSSKKVSPAKHRTSSSHSNAASARKPARHKRRSAAAIAAVSPLDPISATQPAFALSTVAAIELEAFAKVLKNCKEAVGTFSDDQKHKLRLILGRAHRALEKL